MKNQLIFMLGLLVLCLIGIMVGCGYSLPGEKANIDRSYYSDEIRIIEIDSCEYIINEEYNRYGICHKGNCKFCLNRNKSK